VQEALATGQITIKTTRQIGKLMSKRSQLVELEKVKRGKRRDAAEVLADILSVVRILILPPLDDRQQVSHCKKEIAAVIKVLSNYSRRLR